jgi:hypothetical protein
MQVKWQIDQRIQDNRRFSSDESVMVVIGAGTTQGKPNGISLVLIT